MDKFKISKISKNLEIPHGKAKRYAREFLGPDPNAGIQSGHARSLNMGEAYITFLAYHLVSEQSFTIHEAKKIISDLKKWLIERNLFPGEEGGAEPEKPKVKSWKINIKRTDKFCQFVYLAEGLIEREVEYRKYIGGNYKGFHTIRYEVVQLPILSDDFSEGQTMIDDVILRVLRISFLVEIFKLRLEGKNVIENAERWVEHRTF